MYSKINFAALAVGLFNAQHAAAVPVPADEQPVGSFKLPQLANPNFVPNGQAAMAKAYAKYGATMPEDLVNALKRSKGHVRTSGSAPATPGDQYDSEYLVSVAIGTPPVSYHLDLDTGSSDLWVFGSGITAAAGNHTTYDPSKSSTSKLTSNTWTISYGDGSSASGTVYTDVVNVGGIQATSQAVEMATKASAEFVQLNVDGLMGLAFESLNTCSPTKQSPFWTTVSSQLSEQVFTADLRYHEAGAYTFGAIPAEAGAMTYTPLVNIDFFISGYWGMNAAGWGYGGKKQSSTSIQGIADTGTTLLLLDNSTVASYYSAIKGATYNSQQAGFVIPNGAAIPDFNFYVGKSVITVPGQYLCYADVGDGTCFGGLQANTGIGLNIFGDIVLKAAYVVFDFGKKQIGWAQKSTPSSS